MSDRTQLLLLAAGIAAVDAGVAWLTWGTRLLALCIYITMGMIAAIVCAFVGSDKNGGGNINGDGGVGLGI